MHATHPAAGRLAGRSVLVAGATGMAAAAAERLAAEGARVTVTARTAEHCTALVERIRDAGGDAAAHPADLRDETQADAAVAAAVGRFGRLDGLLHVAGGSGRRFGDGPLHEVTLEGWEQTFGINLTTLFLTSRAAVRAMLAQERTPVGRGSVVLVTSVLGFSPAPSHFATHAYAAAKAAVAGLVATTAAYYAPAGIRVNALAPSLVDTPMSARAQGDASTVAYAERRQPLAGPFLAPDDVAGAAAYLLSDESRAITGQLLAIDGGWSVSDAWDWPGPGTAG